MLIEALKKSLKKNSLHKELSGVMDYAVLPAGKLFRPKLVEALSLDLRQEVSQDALHLASAIELHHAYTLVHDDLPAMDNDLIRRGKPSTHAQYGEWKAILAGDALLIASFEEMTKIQNKNFRLIQKIFAWATGAKGLILGQFLDLKANGKQSISDTIRIHELKTARLIQVATVGTHLICNSITLRSFKDFLRLGREIGVTFQLLDDLNELKDPRISPHEELINPFLVSPKEALTELRISHQRLKILLQEYNLKHVEEMLFAYFKNNQKELTSSWKIVEENLKSTETKIEIYGWLTSFV